MLKLMTSLAAASVLATPAHSNRLSTVECRVIADFYSAVSSALAGEDYEEAQGLLRTISRDDSSPEADRALARLMILEASRSDDALNGHEAAAFGELYADLCLN